MLVNVILAMSSPSSSSSSSMDAGTGSANPDSTVVTGLGDEVLLCMLTMALGGLVLLAWWSSNVRERPRVRAVLLQPVRPGVVVAEQVEENEARRRQREAGGRAEVVFAEGSGSGSNRPQDRDRDRDRREENETSEEEMSQAEAQQGSNGNNPDNDATDAASNASARADGDQEEAAVASSSDSEANSASSSSSSPSITIKLKFLNESQREVKAKPSESLGKFKRRHFADDLASNKVVRLIFNGQMLRSDRDTLGDCGLFDNCVVHCLVSSGQQQQQPQQQQQQQQQDHVYYPVDADDGLDLSHICYPLLGSVLLMVWWCQIVYSHYFSMASSLSLFCLTILFAASVTNTYLT